MINLNESFKKLVHCIVIIIAWKLKYYESFVNKCIVYDLHPSLRYHEVTSMFRLLLHKTFFITCVGFIFSVTILFYIFLYYNYWVLICVDMLLLLIQTVPWGCVRQKLTEWLQVKRNSILLWVLFIPTYFGTLVLVMAEYWMSMAEILVLKVATK